MLCLPNVTITKMSKIIHYNNVYAYECIYKLSGTELDIIQYARTLLIEMILISQTRK